MNLHEPRVVSAIYGATYTLAAVVGLLLILFPPVSLQLLSSGGIMFAVGGFLLLGGIVGIVAIILGWFRVERHAVGLTAAGVGFAWVPVLITEFWTTHIGLVILGFLLSVGFVLMRSVWVFKTPCRTVHGAELYR